MQDLREGKSEMHSKSPERAKMSTVCSRKRNLDSLAKPAFDSCQRLDKECEPGPSTQRKRPQLQYVFPLVLSMTILTSLQACSTIREKVRRPGQPAQ